ncbi:MAG: GerMN domain-containing protein [Clostridium sp.]|nr:GerMN domain-containing protein [Clostridium sp.]
MKWFKYILIGILCLGLTACGQNEAEQTTEQVLSQNEIYIYYANSDLTDVEKKIYKIRQTASVTENTDEIMAYFTQKPEDEEVQPTIPSGVEFVSGEYDEGHQRIIVAFNILYDEVNADSLLFFKACVTKTLLQLEGVDKVAIALTDLNNADAETATAIENFDGDSFAMSFGNSNGYQQKGNIVLYFATPDGERLKEYHKSVEISNNTSLAEIVVGALIEGPKQEGYQATVSEETTIRNISVKDGICYVDFSDEFYNTDNPMKNDIIVYSIVNSLVELPTVSKVQFLRNGEKQAFFRETMPFDSLFERNLDLIE